MNANIDRNALRFCRGSAVVFLLVAIAFQLPWLIAVEFVLFLIPAVFTVRAAPMLLLYNSTLRRWITPDFEDADLAALRFAQGFGASLLLASLFCLYVLHTRYGGWIFAGSVAAATAFGAGGFCVGAWIYRTLKRLLGKNA